MPGVERLRRVSGGAVAVVEADAHGIFRGAADERRVEFRDARVEGAVMVALVVVVVDVAEAPPEVLVVLVADGANRGVLATPAGVVEVVGFAVVEGFVAAPHVDRVGRGNHAHGRLADEVDRGRILEYGLRAGFFGGDDAEHVLAAACKRGIAVVVETGAVRVVVISRDVLFERLLCLRVEAFP